MEISLPCKMVFKRTQLGFKDLCDSGYNSLDLDESDSHEEIKLSEEKDIDEEEPEESFSDWLAKVAKCLHSRPKTKYYKDKAEEEEKQEEEGARCMRIVRCVLDEKTVLQMTKDYLYYAKVIIGQFSIK